ncbi:hypothetical protein FGF04_14230 [Streptomyces apricus]|uniref:Uncharacterized protein n=2 Tax=Streptomyces apricus TaxID=1828112 RepID=A0A5B0B133_9ACTN|nr:hypothetical protein FGF04_14230 [Streptomyces apricus]
MERALVEEATKKSGLIWVRGDSVPTLDPGEPAAPARALWHVWHDGAVYVVGDGPGEQPLTGLVDGRGAEVTVRSKDKGGRLVSWSAAVVELTAGSEAWEAAVGELKGKRLNAPDGEAMTERWGRECRVLRLTPTGGGRECRVLRLKPTGVAAGLPDGSLAAAPMATPATTRQPVPAAVPRLLFRRRGRR